MTGLYINSFVSDSSSLILNIYLSSSIKININYSSKWYVMLWKILMLNQRFISPRSKEEHWILMTQCPEKAKVIQQPNPQCDSARHQNQRKEIWYLTFFRVIAKAVLSPKRINVKCATLACYCFMKLARMDVRSQRSQSCGAYLEVVNNL